MDETLVLDNLGLARMVAHKYRNTGLEFDDLEQTSRIGLIKAAKTYDPDRGVKFSAYAVPVMNNEMKMMLRKLRRRVETISLETEIVPGGDITIADTLVTAEDVESVILAKDTAEITLGYLMQIPKEKRDVVIRRVLLHEKQEAIAARCGCSQAYVSRVVKNELEKLRRLLSEGGNMLPVTHVLLIFFCGYVARLAQEVLSEKEERR